MNQQEQFFERSHLLKMGCLWLFILLVIPLIIRLVLFLLWQVTLPAWEIAAQNQPEGVQIEIYLEQHAEPVYRVFLEEKTLPNPIPRSRHQQLPADQVEVLFVDETFKPGRVTLKLLETKLDILSSSLIVNDRQEVFPEWKISDGM